LGRAAHASATASLRARGAPVGADQDSRPNRQGIGRNEWSIRPHVEGRCPKTSSVDTKTNGCSTSSKSCCSDTEGIPVHDHGLSPCVSGSPMNPDRFRRFSRSIPTSS
jgi:hypothetical protein